MSEVPLYQTYNHHQTPQMNCLHCFKIREIPCRVKAAPLLCRVNGLLKQSKYAVAGTSKGWD
jgi:hypothetical protein